MTLQRFQQLLSRIDPNLRLRVKAQGDVVGLFVGYSGKSGYICRLSKGELHMSGFRWAVADQDGILRNGRIRKRGRKTVINLLRNYRWITNHYQRTMLTHGIEYPDHLVRGFTGGSQYGPRV